MEILFLTFANDRNQPLPSLQREDETLYGLLAPRQGQQHFLIHRDSYTGIDKIAEYLNLYRDDIVLFHYSGHADGNNLFLDGQEAKTLGLATLLGQCSKLKLVVLNGCSTKGQVQLLLENGVPAVIATSSPISDTKATEFSIQFYRSLVNQESIKQAADAAKGKVLMMDDAMVFHRGLDLRGQEKEGQWGLFYKDGLEEHTEWTLPAVSSGVSTGAFVPNELLLESLTEALAPFSQDVQKLRDLEEMGSQVSVLDKREAILKCLPHPISEQVRKLLVPEPTGSSDQFYDKLGPARLQQIIAIYNILVELMAFILFSQLWEFLPSKPDVKVSEKVKNKLFDFFKLSNQARKEYNFLPLISFLLDYFEEQDIECFVVEIKRFRAQMAAGSKFYEACLFMESVKNKLLRSAASVSEAETLCILAETKIADILGRMGFLAFYTITSVKNIDVVKYRHSKTPHFRHTVVRLVQRFVGLASEPQMMDQFMDTTSILLIREQNGSKGFLNLSPFIIDENVFDDKASVAKLYFFSRYAPNDDTYAFRHIYKPNDPPLLISKQIAYRVIKSQFDAFAQLLFSQTMNQALL